MSDDRQVHETAPIRGSTGGSPSANAVPVPPSRWKAYGLMAFGLVACPCHIPLWIGLVVGTAFGGFLTQNLVLVALAMGLVFVVAVAWGYRILRQCDACESTAREVGSR